MRYATYERLKHLSTFLVEHIAVVVFIESAQDFDSQFVDVIANTKELDKWAYSDSQAFGLMSVLSTSH